jgi:hypothetical protein
MPTLATAPPSTGAHAAAPWDMPGTPALLSFGAMNYPCQVEHLTSGGALLRCAEPVAPWTVVTVRIDHFGKFHGRVLWQRGDSVGLQFLDYARAAIQLAATA